MNWKKNAMSLVVLSALAIACNPDDATNQNGTAKMNIHLTDAMCGYDEVNVDVQAVEVIYDDSNKVQLNAITPGVYNLLDLNNGIDTLIASEDLPSGYISQVRLILGENNSIMVDSTIHSLQTPSAQQSGLKVKFNTELVSGVEYDITLDFDACKSIVLRGNGTYLLKPVIRVFTDATSGSIEGFVQPDTAVAYTFVVDNTDTLGTMPDSTGYFRINGLSAGTHDVLFEANAPYTDQTVTGVSVTLGQVTDIDTVQF